MTVRFLSAVFVLMLLGSLGCGRVGFSEVGLVEDAGTQCEAGSCGPCASCVDERCVPQADGTACPAGACRDGACCTGCVDGEGCQAGDAPAACGAAGGVCVACADCETCVAGGCTPAADGAECSSGTCVSGNCCTPDCTGNVCGDDGCGGSCGVCPAADRCTDGACITTECETTADCLGCETCNGTVCLPQTDGTTCPDGACYGGVCCTGCWDGTSCRPGNSVGACGGAGMDCGLCGACERCPDASCTPEADGTECTGGLCNDGSCCTGCADAMGCQPGSTLEACGSSGLMCQACGPCEACGDGSCGAVPDLTACLGGVCVSGICCAGCLQGDMCLDGNDVTSCGDGGAMCAACSAPTGAMPVCSAGVCSFVCNIPLADCSGTGMCDTDLSTDSNHCGACGVNCPDCQRCEAGLCAAIPDGETCGGGLCHEGTCCTGCWDGVSCQAGDDGAQCGSMGIACESCNPLQTCGAKCEPNCGYRCAIDVMAGTTDCVGPVMGTLVGMQYTATIDMMGFTELGVGVDLCDPVGWTVHVGDSPTNDGAGGDAGTFSNDAEIQLQNTVTTAFANQESVPPSTVLYSDPSSVPNPGCSKLIWIIGDQRFFIDGVGEITDPTLLRLNPPTDSEGVPDALWYLGINRTFGSAARNGTGAQKVIVCLR